MAEANGGGFTLLRWNGKYGGDAKFVVRDNKSGKQSMFTPGRTQDLVWTAVNLSEVPEIKDWSDFGDETVADLEEVAF